MIRMHRGGLAWRLLLLGVLTLLPVLCAGGWLLRYQLHGVVLRGVKGALSERMGRIVAGLSLGRDASGDRARIQLDHRLVHDEFRSVFSGWYWQIESGDLVERSRSLWDSVLPVGRAERLGLDKSLFRLQGPLDMPLFGMSREVHVDGRTLQLHVYGSGEAAVQDMARIDRVLLLMLVLLALALLLAMYVQVCLGLRPMRKLHDNVQRMHDGDETRVGQGYGPDLDPIAAEIDEVLARNARIVARARGNAADLGHALKKSLALLTAASGGAVVEGGFVARQVASMTMLIERHLSRAGSGAGHLRRIDVGQSVQGLLGLMRQLHVNRKLQWQLFIDGTICWRGEMTDLEEMLGNVLDNAGKWAASRVEVTVRQLSVPVPADGTTRTLRGGRCVEIVVADDGTGLDDVGMEKAMRRGQRLDESVEGSGLGLSIAADIAETYDGTVTLGRSALGGLKVVFRLPG